jgi:hypothetical protein
VIGCSGFREMSQSELDKARSWLTEVSHWLSPHKRASGNCPTNSFPSWAIKDAHDPHTCATHKAAFICMSVQGRLIGCQSQSGDNSAYCETRFRRCAQKSTRHGRIPGFRSHCIRICPCLKPDCACAVQRKAAILTPFSAEQSVLCSPVSLGRIAKNGHVSRILAPKRAEFLYTSDCVAEEERFEPSVRFWQAKPRHVRKLQIAKPYQRISPQNPTSEFATSPVSIRHPFESEKKKRTRGDS